jgi:hypothetical protein
MKVYHGHIHVDHAHGLFMAGHNIKLGHHNQVQTTMIISTKSRFMDCNFREAIEIKVDPSSVNRKDGFCLSISWKPLI